MRNSCWINFILGIGNDRVHEDIMKFCRNEIEKLKRNTNSDFERSAGASPCCLGGRSAAVAAAKPSFIAKVASSPVDVAPWATQCACLWMRQRRTSQSEAAIEACATSSNSRCAEKL
jgi:hypothetical protein